MKRRGFLLLAGATLVLVAGAIVALVAGEREVSQAPAGQRALPGLAQKLGELAWVRLTRGQMKADFSEIGGRWVIVEKSNYPAARVRPMLLALADLTLIEAKTRRPELFARLGLDDPKNGTATLLTVQDREGKTVAELIVGKRRYDRFGGGNDGVYVRRPGDDRSWLARGWLDLSGDVASWLDRGILDIAGTRIASVTLTAADGNVLAIRRPAADGNFAIDNAPPGAKLKNPAVIGEAARALEALTLDDVEPAAELPVPDKGVATATFTTFDALTVELRLFERDKRDWVVIDASGSGPTAAEGKAIVARVARWAYAIPVPKAKLLRMTLADLVEPAPGG